MNISLALRRLVPNMFGGVIGLCHCNLKDNIWYSHIEVTSCLYACFLAHYGADDSWVWTYIEE